MAGAVQAAEQRKNALWTATRYKLSFENRELILWCWCSAGCAGGDRFSSRSLRPAAGKMAHARDRRLCSWPHSRADHSQPPSSRFHVQPSSAPSPGRRRRHALSERGAPHVAWCERGHASRRCPIAQDNSHPLIRQAPLADSSAAHGSAKQCAAAAPAHLQQGAEGCNCTRRCVTARFVVPWWPGH
jgi:hypothetical protein